MRAVEVDEPQIQAVTANLVWSDLVGRHNYGVERLPVLLERVRKGVINRSCRPQFTSLSDSVQLLIGDDGFGHYVCELAVDRAIQLAREHGVGVVGVRDSNFSGTGAYFVHKAAVAGMISQVSSNSFPKVAPHRGTKAVLGTNPFAFGAPRRNDRSLMVDMSTAAIAGSTIREYVRKGRPLPEGLVIDADGNPVTDPKKGNAGTLLPFGEAKGYGIALMVEILSGVITGAGVSHGVKSMYKNFEESAHIGQFFFVMDVLRWMPLETYYERLEGLIGLLKAGGSPDDVQLPGENRWRSFASNSANGIQLEAPTLKALTKIAKECSVEVPWSET